MIDPVPSELNDRPLRRFLNAVRQRLTFDALSPLTTKGDLVAYSTTAARVAVGANNSLLMADSTAAAGVSWLARPVVRVHRNGADQALTIGATDQVQWTTKERDTRSWFDTTTFKFTPLLAGDYRVTFAAAFSSTSYPAGYLIARVRKNGTEVAGAYSHTGSFPAGTGTPVVATIVNLNGSTDYIDCAVTNPAASVAPVLQGLATRSWLAIDFLG